MSEHFDAKLWGKCKREVLDELLTQCTPENRHAEIDFGSPRADVKVKRLHPDAVMPRKAHVADAGFDLVAVEDTIIEPGETALIKTGLAFELPEGYEMQIRPRSGVTLKTKLRVQLGTVDSNYRGEVGVIVDNIAQPNLTVWYTEIDGYVVSTETQGYLLTLKSDLTETFYNGADETTVPLEMGYHRPDGSYIICKGDRIAQAVIQRLPDVELIEVEALGDSERGVKGFGSSGTT